MYNLADDIGESRDLAREMPEKVREMEQLYEAYDSQMKEVARVTLVTAVRLERLGKWPLKKK